jgi:hypothetical protein
MAELDRAKLKADRATYAKRQLRYRGAQAVSSPVPDYDEPEMETYVRLLLADDLFTKATINKAERLLAKKKDPNNKRFFDPAFLGRDGADAQAAKFRLWRTMFPPPEMVGTTILDASADSPSSTDPLPGTSPSSSTDLAPESAFDFTPLSPAEVEPRPLPPESPTDTDPSDGPTEQPLPQWADLFTRETLSRDATWALQNGQLIQFGRAKHKDAPSELAWFLANLINDDQATFLRIIFKKVEDWDAADKLEKRRVEAEQRERSRGDIEVLALCDELESAESAA